jgi:hypothetical protein
VHQRDTAPNHRTRECSTWLTAKLSPPRGSARSSIRAKNRRRIAATTPVRDTIEKVAAAYPKHAKARTAQPAQDPAQRAKLQVAIAKAE